MQKTPGKNLSLIISILIIMIFALTIGGVYVNNFMIAYLWNVIFLITFLLMVIFSIYILFSKDVDHFSIFTAILTALAVGFLSIHALVVVSRFIIFLPQNINFGYDILNNNSQLIFYTSLIVTYFINLINYIRLNRKKEYISEDEISTKKNQGQIDKDANKEELDILNSHITKEDDLLL